MGTEETTELLRRAYGAYATADIAAIDALISADCVMHVSGHHPLSGDYHGKDAIWGYLGKVATIGGGRGGFDVDTITADDEEHGVALLTGTIRDFVRPVIHIWHIRHGQLSEFWDASFDQATEDAFWTSVASG
jgi:ketosteroid isomerase-like protein